MSLHLFCVPGIASGTLVARIGTLLARFSHASKSRQSRIKSGLSKFGTHGTHIFNFSIYKR